MQVVYLAAIFALLLVLLAAYRNSFLQFFDVWQNRSNYSHGFLIGLVTLGLLWRAAGRANFQAAKPNLYFLAPLLGLSLAWLFARLIDVQVLEMGIFPLLLSAWLVVLLGVRVARDFVIPLLFLYFAVPFWEVFAPILQTITVKVVDAQMALVGIPAYIQGNLVTLPTGRFEIASGCSGIGLMIVSLAMASLFAYLNYRTVARRILLVVCGALFAMVINWIRVFIIILSGHLTEMQHYFVTVDHSNLGWVLFAVGLVPFLYVAGRFSDMDDEPAPEPAGPQGVRGSEPGQMRGIAAAALAATVLALAAPVSEGRASDDALRLTSMRAIGYPVVPEGWRREPRRLSAWAPNFPGATIALGNSYLRGDQRADLQVRVYLQESQGRELINDLNELYDREVWQQVASEKLQLSLAPDDSLEVRRLVLRNRKQMLEIWYWYEIGGHSASDPVKAKALQALRIFSGRGDNALVAAGVYCDVPCETPSALLRELLSDMHEPLKVYFAKIADESAAAEGS